MSDERERKGYLAAWQEVRAAIDFSGENVTTEDFRTGLAAASNVVLMGYMRRFDRTYQQAVRDMEVQS